MNVHKCHSCGEDIPNFYSLRIHRQNCDRESVEAVHILEAKNFDFRHILADVGDDSLQEEMETSKLFLVDSEIEKHRVFNFAMGCLNQHLLIWKFKFGVW